MELECFVQKYSWGKLGESSTVASLAFQNSHEIIKKDVPYAELWMGVHPSGPSRLKDEQKLLQEHIALHPELLGSPAVETFGITLPYLFKVLSVETALSIQAHPSKSHAEELFKKFPETYKDPNHKPELAIALTHFEALCGFRPRKEIEQALNSIPQLKELLGEEKINSFLIEKDQGIRPCFETLMTCKPERVKSAIDSYLLSNNKSLERNLVERLNKQFPGDVGCLCVFWLNYVTLSPGEALFLAPNEPHAYLYGDCVECMANSDNVVRAGLTPKYRDVTTLCEMLSYQPHSLNEIKFQSEKEDDCSNVFKPPVKDFAVAQIIVPAGVSYNLKPRSSASIILAINGRSTVKSNQGVTSIKSGVVLFLPAQETLSVTAESHQTLYQAFCNL